MAKFFSFLITLILITNFSHAQVAEESKDSSQTSPEASPETSPVIPKPLNVMPSKIKPIQSGDDELSKAAPESRNQTSEDNDTDDVNLDALTLADVGNLGNDYWVHSSHADVLAFLNSSVSPHLSGSLRDMTLRAVLTPAVHLPPSSNAQESLYSARLQKLVTLGAYDYAQKLYKMTDATMPNAKASQAGIEALLGHGETGAACLDQKIASPEFKSSNQNFWTNIEVFCKALLGPVAGTDDALRLSNVGRAYLEIIKPQYTSIDEVNNLDSVSLIALKATGQLSKFLNNETEIKKLSNQQLGIVLAYLHPQDDNLVMLAEGLKRGLIDFDKIVNHLQKIDLKTTTSPDKDFLVELLAKKPPVLTPKLLQVAKTPAHDNFLIPLLETVDFTPTQSESKRLILLSLGGQSEIPENWVNIFTANASTESDKPEKSDEILLNYLAEKFQSAQDFQSLGLIQAVLEANYPQNDTKTAYDNIFNLTASFNYVMPNEDILSSLQKSAEKKLTHQVVIECLTILSDTPMEQINPAVFYQVLQALKSVGLNEVTRSLSRKAIGTVLEKLK